MHSPNGPRVVIVGGGFGGLYVARGLAGAPARVTLIDRHNYHLFRPMTYQAATGLLSADQIAVPLRSVLRKQHNTEVFMAEVTGVDTVRRVVQFEKTELEYDFLILATGIHYNYFGHEEWRQLAPGLDTVDDADRIRAKILLAFEEAEKLGVEAKTPGAPLHEAEIHELLTFVLVGGGAAGVEMAGTMAEMVRLTLKRDFRHINPASARILLFEAAPRILPTYPEDLSAQAARHLEQLGVEIHTGSPVEKIDAEGVMVGGQRIRTRTTLWSAGVLASPAGRWLGAETDKSGRVKVTPNLSVPGHPEVFVVGDTAALTAPTRDLLGFASKVPEPMPGVAQVAIQEGRYVAKLIRRRIAGKGDPPPFWYWDKGNIAIVGRTFAVADLKFVRFSGFFAWLLWAVVHIYFLIGFSNRLFVSLQWGISFLTKRRAVRIFPQADVPKDS